MPLGPFKRLGVKMTPELKSASVPMPFDGVTQQSYAQKVIDEYNRYRQLLQAELGLEPTARLRDLLAGILDPPGP